VLSRTDSKRSQHTWGCRLRSFSFFVFLGTVAEFVRPDMQANSANVMRRTPLVIASTVVMTTVSDARSMENVSIRVHLS
jgi:arginine exporter protein ArgO